MLGGSPEATIYRTPEYRKIPMHVNIVEDGKYKYLWVLPK